MKSIFESNLFKFNNGSFVRLDEEEFVVPGGHVTPKNPNDPPRRMISGDETDKLFKNFEDSYTKSVGSSHDRNWFDHRAPAWVFWGTVDGGVAARMQSPEVDELGPDGKPTGTKTRKDLWAMKASYGSTRGVFEGMKEFIQKHGKEPVYAVLTPNLGNAIAKRTDEFFIAPKPFVKALYPVLTSGRGGDYFASQIRCMPDGTLMAKTPAGQDLEKIVILNKAYIDSFFPQYKEGIEEFLKDPSDPLFNKLLDIYVQTVQGGDMKKAKEEAFKAVVEDLVGQIGTMAVQTGAMKSALDWTDRLQNNIVRDVETAKDAWDAIPRKGQRALKKVGLGILRTASPETREWLRKHYSDLGVLYKMLKDPDYVEPPPVRNPFEDRTFVDDRTGQPTNDGVPPGPEERE